MDRERGAVLEEINRSENSLSNRLGDTLLGQYVPGHPSGLVGTRPEGQHQNISREEILRFVGQYYEPANRAVIAVGDFDTKTLLETVRAEHEKRPFKAEKTFQPLHPLKAKAPVKSTTLYKDVQMSQSMTGFKGPDPKSPGYEKELAAIELLSKILSGGTSSRFNRILVENEELAIEGRHRGATVEIERPDFLTLVAEPG